MAKVLLLNGSPHAHGCTAAALEEMIRVFSSEGIETELIQVGNQAIRGCVSCNACSKLGRCVINDDLVTRRPRSWKRRTAWWSGAPSTTAPRTGRFWPFWTGCSTARPFRST